MPEHDPVLDDRRHGRRVAVREVVRRLRVGEPSRVREEREQGHEDEPRDAACRGASSGDGFVHHEDSSRTARLAFGHEPAAEQAHSARSRDVASTGTASAGDPSQATAEGRGRGGRGHPRARSGSRHRRDCGGARLRIVLRPQLAAAGRHRRELVRLRRRRLAARLDSGGAEPPAGDRGGHVARGCARRRSRSRTGASTSTAASTSRASRAQPSRTSRPGQIVEGGSTITQQLVRNLYISREQTVQRKVKEACLAIEARRRVVEAADPRRRT